MRLIQSVLAASGLDQTFVPLTATSFRSPSTAPDFEGNYSRVRPIPGIRPSTVALLSRRVDAVITSSAGCCECDRREDGTIVIRTR